MAIVDLWIGLADDGKRIREMGAEVIAVESDGAKALVAVWERGPSEGVDMTDNVFEDVRLLRAWCEAEEAADEYGLKVRTVRAGAFRPPSWVSILDSDGDVLASAPCTRETGPAVVLRLLREMWLDEAIADLERGWLGDWPLIGAT